MRPDRPGDGGRKGRGLLLLAGGLLLLAVLVASGVRGLTLTQPDMVHLNHAVGTCVGGPIAVVLVAAGMSLLRRGR